MKLVAFDFDGTLIHSNETKRQVIEEFCDQVGVPKTVCRNWMRNSHDRSELAQLAAQYSAIHNHSSYLGRRLSNRLDEAVLNCELRTGVVSTLRWLLSEGVKVCLNSATPKTNLDNIVQQIPAISRYVHKVYGGPSSKLDNLHQIACDFSVSPADILIVGDGVDDLEVAVEVGSAFVGVRGGSLSDSKDSGVTFIDDLNDIQLSVARVKNKYV